MAAYVGFDSVIAQRKRKKTKIIYVHKDHLREYCNKKSNEQTRVYEETVMEQPQ